MENGNITSVLLFNHSYYRKHGNTITVGVLLHCSFTPQVSLMRTIILHMADVFVLLIRLAEVALRCTCLNPAIQSSTVEQTFL